MESCFQYVTLEGKDVQKLGKCTAMPQKTKGSLDRTQCSVGSMAANPGVGTSREREKIYIISILWVLTPYTVHHQVINASNAVIDVKCVSEALNTPLLMEPNRLRALGKLDLSS